MANLSLFWVVLWFFRVGITGNSNLQFSSLSLLSKTLNQRVRHLHTKEKKTGNAMYFVFTQENVTKVRCN